MSYTSVHLGLKDGFPGEGTPQQLGEPPEREMLFFVLLIAWIGVIAVVAFALAKAARVADAQSDAQWRRWARAQPARPPVRSRRGGLAA
jgi:hypothetical protein